MAQRISELDRLPKPRKGAYFGDKNLKFTAVSDMVANRKADAFIQGLYGTIMRHGRKELFRGCAVGCAIMSAELRKTEKEEGRKFKLAEVKKFQKEFNSGIDPHERMADYYNISPELARLEDHIFETLPLSEAKRWPVQFLKALPTGANLSGVVTELCRWVNKNHRDWIKEYYGPENYWAVSNADEIASVMLRWNDVLDLKRSEMIRMRNSRARIVRDQLLKIIKSRAAKG